MATTRRMSTGSRGSFGLDVGLGRGTIDRMNILVVSGHPDTRSFHAAITQAYLAGLAETSHAVEVIDLATAEFDPVLRFGYRERMPEDPFIARSQELLLWADHLVFIYPVWWSSMPSVLKGWVDRVFTPGVAYSSNARGNFLVNFVTGRQFKKLLKGKTAEIIVTSQGPTWWYPLFSGPMSVPDSYGVAVLKSAVLNHCGVKTKKVMALGNMRREKNTPEMREKFLEKVWQRAAAL